MDGRFWARGWRAGEEHHKMTPARRPLGLVVVVIVV